MWLYQDKNIERLEDFGEITPFGFIYKITHIESDKFYIGKKQIMSYTNQKLGKKELAALPVTRGRKKTKKKVIKESKWVDYCGSSKPLNKEIKTLGLDKFKKEILLILNTKKELTYWELAYQMKYDVLRTNSWNESILGRYHTKDFVTKTN